jgi:hypothetical protein
VPDGPNRLRETWFVGGDMILDFADRAHLWGAYGEYRIDSQGGSFYDRTLQYWIAELIVHGAWLGESFRPFYTGFRAQSLGTSDSDDGYLLDVRRSGSLGYNMHELKQYSTVLGWDITEWLRMRAEYTVQDIEVVRGVTNAIRDSAHNANYFAVELDRTVQLDAHTLCATGWDPMRRTLIDDGIAWVWKSDEPRQSSHEAFSWLRHF